MESDPKLAPSLPEGRKPPPGYRLATSPGPLAIERAPAAAFSYLLAALVLLGFSAKHCVEQAFLYSPLFSVLAGKTAAFSLALGAVWGLGMLGQRRWPGRSLPELLTACGVALAVSSAAVLASSGVRPTALPILLLSSFVQGGVLVVLSVELVRRFGADSLRLGIVPWVLHPLRAAFLSLTVTVGLVFGDRVGVTLWPVVLALAWLCLALLTPTAQAQLPGDDQRAGPWTSTVLAAGTLLIAGALLVVLDRVPVAVKTAYGANVLFQSGSRETQHVVAVGHLNGPELFVDGRLHVGRLKSERYAEQTAALTGKLLELRPSPGAAHRVLLLGTGSGLHEKALLKRTQGSLTTLTPSNDVAQWAASWPWLEAMTHSRQHASRIERVVAEPLPWLRRETRQFDAIVLDVGPPLDVRSGVFYTTYFLRLLGERLSEHGVVIMPGLSRLNTPAAAACLRASAEAVGFRVDTHDLAWPGAGDWSLLVLTPSKPRPHTHVSTLQNLQVLDDFTREYVAAFDSGH